MMTWWSGVAALAAACSCFAQVQPPRYELVDLGGAVPGVVLYGASDINDRGELLLAGPQVGLGQMWLWIPSMPNGASGSATPLPLPPGAIGSDKGVINNRGQVAGRVYLSDLSTRVFLWSPAENGGLDIPVGLPGSTDSARFDDVYDINDYGQVVGWGLNWPHIEGAIWTPQAPGSSLGTTVLLDTPGVGFQITPSAIGADGTVVGYGSGSGGPVGFAWRPVSPNAMTGELVYLGPVCTTNQGARAEIITADGRAIGWSDCQQNGLYFIRATVWDTNSAQAPFVDGQPIILELAYAYTEDANDLGMVVGYSDGDSSGNPTPLRGWLWSPSYGSRFLDELIDEGLAGWDRLHPFAINERGQIVGKGYFDPDGQGALEGSPRAFLLQPLTQICNRSDINGDGQQSVPDIFQFLNYWFAGDIARANYNGDCCINVVDIFDFLADWFLGCR